MRGAQPGAKKSVPRLRWFPLRANPVVPWREATKSGRIRAEEGGKVGRVTPCAPRSDDAQRRRARSDAPYLAHCFGRILGEMRIASFPQRKGVTSHHAFSESGTGQPVLVQP